MAALLCLLASVSATRADDKPVQFNRDIRPILSEHCFACHGPDGRNRQAGLRLDVEADAKAELESGLRGIVAGKPDESELLARLTSDDPSERMPPAETGKTLSPEQIQLVRRWIAEGARWEGHWSFQPISRPVPPVVDASDAVRNPVDAFVRAKLAEQGLSAAPPADAVTLLRRVHFDLIGLPPTPAEVEQFLADSDPDAFEKVVDRLLASPRFGERLAANWLDLVRYADSVGLFADQSVRVSPYRDYVISAFNSNLPFDQFTIEQLAGDLLPDRTREQHVASAYNRLGRMSTESGVQEKEYLAKYIAERVRNTGTTWLGLTLGCCECHDHKYDPLSARDFYQLAAYFADIRERGVYVRDTPVGIDFGPSLRLGTPAQLDELARLVSEVDQLDADRESVLRDVRQAGTKEAAQLAAWEQSLRRSHHWHDLQPVSVTTTSGAVGRILTDHSILIVGPRADRDNYLVRVRVPLAKFSAIRLEVLPDSSLPGRGPGRGTDGNFVLTGFDASVVRGKKHAESPMPFRTATASFEQTDRAGDEITRIWSAELAIHPRSNEPALGWAITEKVGQRQEAVFETVEDITCSAGDELLVRLRQQHGRNATIGRFKLSVTDASRPVETFGYALPAAIRRALQVPADRRSDEELKEIAEYFVDEASPDGRARQQQRQKLRSKLDVINHDVPSVLVPEAVEPRTIRVLKRGNWQDETGEVVLPGVPASLPQGPEKSGRGTRLDLARWLVSPENPLTARVLVNRLWKLYFGAALSRKVDDLGSQGEWPTHPELLDWLAAQCVDSGWDLKQTIRLMVTSAAYRQSSVPSAEARERDPENRWLSHQSRYRLDAELVRDNALAVSGLLSPVIGGPSVFPYQPAGYWDIMSKPPRQWRESRGEGIYRRGLYTHWQRQYLHPMLSAFDAPSREECAADRPRSNTPMQALVLLNDPTFTEAARVLAQQSFSAGRAATEQRLAWLFAQILSRQPAPSERTALEKLLESELARYRANPQAARALLAVGRAPVPEGIDPGELAAWTSLVRVILNLHETVTRK